MSLQTLTVNEGLPIILHQLATDLGIQFDQSIVEDIIKDTDDPASFKFYVLYNQRNFFWPDWSIEGTVGEYEPDILWLQSRGGYGKEKVFDAFFQSLTARK